MPLDLSLIYQKYRNVKDSNQTPIDESILDCVVFLNALGVETEASCGGHKERGESPWIDFRDTEQEKINNLLLEFYGTNEGSDSELITFSFPGFFSLQNRGRWGVLDGLKGEERDKKWDEYRQEVNKFTIFLKNKCQNSAPNL